MFGRKTKKLLSEALAAALDTAVAVANDANLNANKALQLLDRMIAENELLRMEKAMTVKGCDAVTAERDALVAKMCTLDTAYLRNCGVKVDE